MIKLLIKKTPYLFLFFSFMLVAKNKHETPVKIEKISVIENTKGIGFGFWCNGKRSADMFSIFGRRPYERYGFFNWRVIEPSPGVYETDAMVKGIQTVHSLGSTCIIAMNNISGPWFNKSRPSQIPSFYKQDITNPETRAAAKKYVYTVVKTILPKVGNIILCFDYEMMWHCRPDTPEKQIILRDWFLDAVFMARQAASEVGMSENLKIIPIVNGSVDDSNVTKLLNSTNKNHVPAQWLLDIVSVCDYLAIDSYDFDINNPTLPFKTIETLGFWIKHYSMGKPVHITEFGYSTANTHHPEYRTNYHATGTEEQQAAFYDALLPYIVKQNVVGKSFNGQVRSFSFWMFSDAKTNKKEAIRENYFGLIRLDGRKKPSADIVIKHINNIENNPESTPYLLNNKLCITPKDLESGVPVSFASGVEHDYLLALFNTKQRNSGSIEVKLSSPGTLLVEVENNWYHSLESSINHKIPISFKVSNFAAKIFVTDGKIPSNNYVKSITIIK